MYSCQYTYKANTAAVNTIDRCHQLSTGFKDSCTFSIQPDHTQLRRLHFLSKGFCGKDSPTRKLEFLIPERCEHTLYHITKFSSLCVIMYAISRF